MTNDDEWAEAAAGWDDEPAVRAYAAAAFDSLGAILDRHGVQLEGAHVCDFGCGTGLMTERLIAAGATVDAVDSSPAMLEVLRAKVEGAGLIGVEVLQTLPPDARDHDLVVCSSVCAFLPDYPAAVVDLVERLRPGGVFVQWDWERSADEPEGMGLTRAEIDAALSSAGLIDVEVDIGFEAVVDGYPMRPLVGHGRRPTT